MYNHVFIEIYYKIIYHYILSLFLVKFYLPKNFI